VQGRSAEGFEQHLTPDGEWAPYWTGWDADVRQMTRQAAAAAFFGKRVEWHVAEKPIADILGAYAEANFWNVRVIWDPPISGRRDKRELLLQAPSSGFLEQMRRLASPGAPKYWIGVGADGRPTLVSASQAC